jgi:hypothetical protein
MMRRAIVFLLVVLGTMTVFAAEAPDNPRPADLVGMWIEIDYHLVGRPEERPPSLVRLFADGRFEYEKVNVTEDGPVVFHARGRWRLEGYRLHFSRIEQDPLYDDFPAEWRILAGPGLVAMGSMTLTGGGGNRTGKGRLSGATCACPPAVNPRTPDPPRRSGLARRRLSSGLPPAAGIGDTGHLLAHA